MRKIDDEGRKPGRWSPPVGGTRPNGPSINPPMHGIVNTEVLGKKRARPREWIVEGVIPKRAVTLLSGDGGLGKSLLALQLTCCVVLGRNWLGLPTKSGHAVYVTCEDDTDEVHIRLEQISESEGWDITELGGHKLIDRTCMENFIMQRDAGFNPWEPSHFWIQLSNYVLDCEASLLVLDSLYDFYPGNQLDQSSVRKFMNLLSELAYEAGIAIVVLMHPSQSGMQSGDGASGSRAFRNASRAMLYLESGSEEGADDRRAPSVLKDKKANRGEPGFEMAIKWESGRFVPCRQETSAAPTGFLGSIEVEQAFLACLDAASSQNRFYSHSKGVNYAPKAFAKMREAKGFNQFDLSKAMERLFADRKIEVGQIGAYANRSPKMGVKRTERAIQKQALQATSQDDLSPETTALEAPIADGLTDGNINQ